MATYTYEPQELYYEVNGGTKTVSLTAVDYDVIKDGWTLKTSDIWHESSIDYPMSSNATLSITVEPNNTTERRDDEIKIFFNDDYVGTLMLTQEQKEEEPGESGGEEEESRVTNTFISGFTSNRIITRKVFNSQLRNNYFTSELDKCIKSEEVSNMSWSSTTMGYSIKLNNSNIYSNSNRLVKCGDIFRENTVLEKTLTYTITFGTVTIGNTTIPVKDPNWEYQGGGTYSCDTEVMFRAYDGDSNIIYEQVVNVHLEGISDSGSEWIYSINGGIDSVFFTAKEFNPCTICHLEPYEYVNGISSNSYCTVPANENNTVYWGDVTIELMSDK